MKKKDRDEERKMKGQREGDQRDKKYQSKIK